MITNNDIVKMIAFREEYLSRKADCENDFVCKCKAWIKDYFKMNYTDVIDISGINSVMDIGMNEKFCPNKIFTGGDSIYLGGLVKGLGMDIAVNLDDLKCDVLFNITSYLCYGETYDIMF